MLHGALHFLHACAGVQAPGDSQSLWQVQYIPAINTSLVFLEVEEQTGQQRKRNRAATRKGSAVQQQGASKVGKQKENKQRAVWDENVSKFDFRKVKYQRACKSLPITLSITCKACKPLVTAKVTVPGTVMSRGQGCFAQSLGSRTTAKCSKWVLTSTLLLFSSSQTPVQDAALQLTSCSSHGLISDNS